MNVNEQKEAIAKADTLIEAMGWIRRFRGKTTVIKLGGSLMGNSDALRHTLIERFGGRAMNLNFRTTNVLFGEKLLLEEAGSEPIDLGFVGQVTRVDRPTIESLTYTEQIPIIPSMCIDANGQKYNVNADTAAMAVAEALGAEKLIFISDVNGVRRDKADPESVIHSMTAAEARQLIADGVIVGGMIPKVEACLSTLDRGVGKVHIIDGQLRHSLLLEIYTTAGVGTEIVQSRQSAATRIGLTNT